MLLQIKYVIQSTFSNYKQFTYYFIPSSDVSISFINITLHNKISNTLIQFYKLKDKCETVPK